MSLRVYVAGSPLETERAERWSEKLRSVGIVVTSVWCELARAHGANPISASKVQRDRWSRDTLAAVDMADVLWLHTPEDEAAVPNLAEFCFAFKAGLTLISSGVATLSSFTAMGSEFDSDEKAFDHILHLAEQVAR